jgi:hypothetical protein
MYSDSYNILPLRERILTCLHIFSDTKTLFGRISHALNFLTGTFDKSSYISEGNIMIWFFKKFLILLLNIFHYLS